MIYAIYIAAAAVVGVLIGLVILAAAALVLSLPAAALSPVGGVGAGVSPPVAAASS